MKKSNWYIATNAQKSKNGTRTYKYELVSGHVDTFKSPDGTEIKIGIRKVGDRYWTMDEVSTGFGIKGAAKKTEALSLLTEDLLQSIANILKQEEAKVAQISLKTFMESIVEEKVS